jgi:aryl-alcohol dehydrogenase-like predicted oxidoreductase
VVDGATVSSLGMGTYLGECDDADDARYGRALRHGLQCGINLIDAAINYRCQRSERVTGRAVRDAIREGVLQRDEVVVCTKGGYLPLEPIPPHDRTAYHDYLRREYFDPGVLAPSDLVADGHCITAPYLAHELARSRLNLGLHTVDVYYIHNPEQQLDVCTHTELLRRLGAAFEMLESRVASGEVVRYGCATWSGFRELPEAPGALSLAELVGVARDVAGESHHFRVVQAPINLAMLEAVRLPTQRGRDGSLVPLLDAAAELGVAVVASASLMQAKLTDGLPSELREMFPGLQTDAQRAIAFTRSLPGVSCALVGMKEVRHLSENLRAAERT